MLVRSHLSSVHLEFAARYFDLSELVLDCDADLVSSCTDTHRSGCQGMQHLCDYQGSSMRYIKCRFWFIAEELWYRLQFLDADN
jgi:hypothetical protein